MTSALDIMALAMLKQLTARGIATPSLEVCKDILRQVIDEAAAVAERVTAEREPA